MNFRAVFSFIGIFIGGFLILAGLNKGNVIKTNTTQIVKKEIEQDLNLDFAKNDKNNNITASAGITFNLYKDRYLVSGNIPKAELERITKNIEQGKGPGTKYSALATTPARGVELKPLGLGGNNVNSDSSENFPRPLNYKVPGQKDNQICYSLGKNDDCRSGYKDSNGECIVCIIGPSSLSDISVMESYLPENIVRSGQPNQLGRPWTGGGPQSAGQRGRPNVPYPYPHPGPPAPGLTEPNYLGERCYKTREGQIWCARSPAFTLSPTRGPTIPGGPIGACGYNKKREGEQCGTDQWPDQLEIGLCRDITHSAWTPCGPGAPPLQAEETVRGLPLTTPPCITWGGCSYPCFCMPLPSGNCKGNLWCVGPPGCTCCPGLACNVCCQADNYLWDSVTGWCACASNGESAPIEPSPTPTEPSTDKGMVCIGSSEIVKCKIFLNDPDKPITSFDDPGGSVIAQGEFDPNNLGTPEFKEFLKIFLKNNSFIEPYSFSEEKFLSFWQEFFNFNNIPFNPTVEKILKELFQEKQSWL